MDNRLLLTVLFVTLSWMSMSTDAQTTNMATTAGQNMTTAAGDNMTTAAGDTMTTAAGDTTTAAGDTTAAGHNMTTAAGDTTAAGHNMTTAAGDTTAAGHNMTTAAGDTTAAGHNMTTAAGDTTAAGHNMTTAAGDTTAAGHNMTTAAGDTTAAGHNMTTAAGQNMTTAAGQNMTTAAGDMTTAAGDMTTAAGHNMTTVATEAPPLTPNITVETLETPVSNTGCRTRQLCAAEPSDCNPAQSGSCFFLAAAQLSGRNFEFSLSGESDGYIAASLSPDDTVGNNDTTYVCAKNNGVVRFFSTRLNNGKLTETELNVNSVRGKINGGKIQCTFAATVPESATRATVATNLALGVSTGTYNSSSSSLGSPNFEIRTRVLDLANPNTTVNNEISSTTTTNPPTTATGHGVTLQQSLTQALLISVGVLGLALL